MEWTEGMACVAVEHDAETGQPKDGGAVREAEIEQAGAAFVNARIEGGPLWAFYQGSGWGATPELSRWRLMPREADMFDALPGLTAIRTAVIKSPEVKSATILSLRGTGPLATFTAVLADGMSIRVDLSLTEAEADAVAADARPAGQGEER